VVAVTAPPFPYFGGKRRAAPLVWSALGNVSRYVEPFFGSGAVLLGSPYRPKSELVNDRCDYIANLWRSIQQDPETVERIASAPSSERELKARHRWLFHGEGVERLAAIDWDDLAACDAEVGGLWLWCACVSVKVSCSDLHRSNHGMGVKAWTWAGLRDVVRRVERVQVLRGDWSRCVTEAALRGGRPPAGTGVFLDPPYGDSASVHYDDGTGDTARGVWDWAVLHGDIPWLRIVVAGYDDGREIPDGWSETVYSGWSGYQSTDNANRHRERLWCSPHCVHAEQGRLFS